jgi:two-component system, NtrC family, response regulator AtoC
MERVRHAILVVDDEAGQRQLLRAILEKDHDVTTASSSGEAVQLLEKRVFDLVITDQRMPGLSGIDLIRWCKEQVPETPIIVLTAFGSIQTAVEAVKLGAQDYLTKPLKNPEELRRVVARVLGERDLRTQNLAHRVEAETLFPPDIVAESRGMRQVLSLAAQVAPQPTTVLLTGESGTGKEVVARFIHRSSPRANGPFVAINCAALTDTLLASELFGHEKGAFTGAIQAKRGRFELAHGGTLFLDEIGEMSVELQSKLLRVLQERQFERVGGVRTIEVDTRVLAATNQDLHQAIQEKRFREDLYYRLNVFPIHIPPLRERREDVAALAELFLGRLSARMGRPNKKLSPETGAVLTNYAWPGNVRELQNALERALIVSPGEMVLPEHLPLNVAPVRESGARTLAEAEKQLILEVLDRHSGDRRKTAEELGISLRTLQYRLKEYGLTR